MPWAMEVPPFYDSDWWWHERSMIWRSADADGCVHGCVDGCVHGAARPIVDRVAVLSCSR